MLNYEDELDIAHQHYDDFINTMGTNHEDLGEFTGPLVKRAFEYAYILGRDDENNHLEFIDIRETRLRNNAIKKVVWTFLGFLLVGFLIYRLTA